MMRGCVLDTFHHLWLRTSMGAYEWVPSEENLPTFRKIGCHDRLVLQYESVKLPHNEYHFEFHIFKYSGWIHTRPILG